MTDHVWQVGQRVAVYRRTVTVDRRTVATVEKVTKGGRARVGDALYHNNGSEVGGGYLLRQIEPLTAEIEVAMAEEMRANDASLALDRAIVGALSWSLGRFSNAWTHREPCVSDIEKAERIVAAIKREMGDGE